MSTAIYFDLDGTLIDYDRPFEDIFYATVPEPHGESMFEDWQEHLLKNLTEMVPQPYFTAFESICSQYDLDISISQLTEEYINTEVNATQPVPQSQEILERLAKHHDIGILTNGDHTVQQRKITAHGFDDIVDEVIISNEIGIRKPNPDIFKVAKRRLEADNHLYIGDTVREDIIPALNNGFHTIYIGNTEEEVPIQVKDLRAIADLLTIILSDNVP
ncbi:MAG: HAD family hydrolase [Halobacteriaceae archaeon]